MPGAADGLRRRGPARRSPTGRPRRPRATIDERLRDRVGAGADACSHRRSSTRSSATTRSPTSEFRRRRVVVGCRAGRRRRAARRSPSALQPGRPVRSTRSPCWSRRPGWWVGCCRARCTWAASRSGARCAGRCSPRSLMGLAAGPSSSSGALVVRQVPPLAGYVDDVLAHADRGVPAADRAGHPGQRRRRGGLLPRGLFAAIGRRHPVADLDAGSTPWPRWPPATRCSSSPPLVLGCRARPAAAGQRRHPRPDPHPRHVVLGHALRAAPPVRRAEEWRSRSPSTSPSARPFAYRPLERFLAAHAVPGV